MVVKNVTVLRYSFFKSCCDAPQNLQREVKNFAVENRSVTQLPGGRQPALQRGRVMCMCVYIYPDRIYGTAAFALHAVLLGEVA